MNRIFTAAALIATVGLATSASAASINEQRFDYGASAVDLEEPTEVGGDSWSTSTSLIDYNPTGGLDYANLAGATGGGLTYERAASLGGSTRQATQDIADIDFAAYADGQVFYIFALGRVDTAITDSNAATNQEVVIAIEAGSSVNNVTFAISENDYSVTTFGSGTGVEKTSGGAYTVGETLGFLLRVTKGTGATPADTLVEGFFNPDLTDLSTADFSYNSKLAREGGSNAIESVTYGQKASFGLTGEYTFDELVITTDLNDIAVPEPGSLALLGLGGLLIASRRRRG